MHDVPEVCAKLPQMAAYSSTYEMVVPSGILSVGLQSPMVVPRVLVYGLHGTRAIVRTCPHACVGFAELSTSRTTHWVLMLRCRLTQNCPHARRRHPTAYAVHCSARNKTPIHLDLCHFAMRSTCKISQTWPVRVPSAATNSSFLSLIL